MLSNYQKLINMGIRNLNRYLSDHCSQTAIKKINLKELCGKTIVIDTSIYMYKFVSQNALIEQMYALITILFFYNITPIFVFDGKSPPEKRDLLKQRSKIKKDAEKKYNELKCELSNSGETADIIAEMESLKKKFVRIRDDDIRKIKALMDSCGVVYCDADGESDKLCAYIVQSGIAWACLSDDMDMFVYGCTRILRHVSLLKHTAILYDLPSVLNDLSISLSEFRKVSILSGTDYNIHDKISLRDSFNNYNKFKEENDADGDFYNWLIKNTTGNYDIDTLNKINEMFCVDECDVNLCNKLASFQTKKMNIDAMKQILKGDGFVFA